MFWAIIVLLAIVGFCSLVSDEDGCGCLILLGFMLFGLYAFTWIAGLFIAVLS